MISKEPNLLDARRTDLATMRRNGENEIQRRRADSKDHLRTISSSRSGRTASFSLGGRKAASLNGSGSVAAHADQCRLLRLSFFCGTIRMARMWPLGTSHSYDEAGAMIDLYHCSVCHPHELIPAQSGAWRIDSSEAACDLDLFRRPTIVG